MIVQYEAAWAVHQALQVSGFSYATIGGVALQHWGEPRFTKDLDLTVLVDPGDEPRLGGLLTRLFQPRIPDAVEFSLQSRVLLIRVNDLCDVDISFGLPGFETELMGRAVDYDIGQNRKIRLCSAEDLIVLKLLALRPRDREDVVGILQRQGSNLDKRYIRLWLREFCTLLESQEALEAFDEMVESSVPPSR